MSLPLNFSMSPFLSVPENSTTPVLLLRLTSIQQSPSTAAILTRSFCQAGTPVALGLGSGDALGDGDGLTMPRAPGVVVGSSPPSPPFIRPSA